MRTLIVLAALVGTSMPSSASAACLSQGEAQQAVSSGQAQPLGSVAGTVQGEIVRAQLCEEGGRYIYRLSVLENGQVTTVVVDASR
ncbi:PepSY domain-containing protein [Pannonibacter sp. SL95]|uniref:PepSY domain-containing protein n=1 Tax=Pannonibacter sp. SL95 TaxID=2995153 RepID=UPI0022759F1B|nr:hypothetical protein [Pannonibacter sp. SL95]MCY1708616.1 hypothetical protein [Pannonibacter sp. SL95]